MSATRTALGSALVVVLLILGLACGFDTTGPPGDPGADDPWITDGGIQILDPADPADPSASEGSEDPSDPGGSASEDGQLVTICHLETTKPPKRHTIVVEPSSVKAHLDHGDALGKCTNGR